MTETIDMRGVACPGPVVAVKKKTDDMIAGELVVLVDNQAAVQNLERFADYKGFDTVWEKTGDKEYAVQILVGPKALRGVDEYFSIYARKQLDQKGKEKETDAPEKAAPERGAKLEPEHRPAPERRPELEHRPEPESRPEPEHLEMPGEDCETCELMDPKEVLAALAGEEEPEPHPEHKPKLGHRPELEHRPEPESRPEPERRPEPEPRPETRRPAPQSVMAAPAPAPEPPAGPTAPGTGRVISSAPMGNGDDTLGRMLLKGFLYAMVEQRRLPETILFYNSGVFLTTEGSGALDDLRELERRGVKILSCGTCLNHFGLFDRLQVGAVTNMYEIALHLTEARKVIRP